MATTVCATGRVHTHSMSHAHFLCTFSLRDVQTRTRMAQGVCSVCVCHISPSRPLHSHVSSTVFAVPALSIRHHVLVCTVFVELYQTHKRGSSAPPDVRRGVWLPGRSHAPTGYEPKEFDKTTSVDGNTTPIDDPDNDSISEFSKTTRENTGLAKEACLGKPLQGREKEVKEKVQRSLSQSRCQRNVDGTVPGDILFRLTEDSILMNEVSENTLNELNRIFLVKIQFRENFSRLSTTWRSKIWSEEIQNTHYSSHSVSMNLKDDNYWKPINGHIKPSVREYTCVVNWR